MLLLDGATAGGAIVAVGERGTIIRSTDGARTWAPATAPRAPTLTGVSFADDGRHGWAVGHDALVLATTDGGVTWVRQYQGDNLEDSFLDVLALDDRHVIAIGAYGLGIVTRDAGQTWERLPIASEDPHLNRISRGPAGTLYIAGERGTLLRSPDGGTTWTPMTSPYEGSFFGVVPLDERTLLAHGLRGHVFRSEDDGASWAPVVAPTTALLATAVRRQNDFIVFAGQARTLLVSGDGGRTVRASREAPPTAVAELIELENGSLLALGEDGATVLESQRFAAP